MAVSIADGGVITLSGRSVEYTLRVSTRAKNMRLQVGAETGLEVIVPENFKPGQLTDILKQKQKWILAKLDYFARVTDNRRLFHEPGRRQVLYQGQLYEVETRPGLGRQYQVAVENQQLVVTMPVGGEAYITDVLEQWLRQQARRLIYSRIQKLNKQWKLSFNRIFIKDQKTCWGSCSTQRNLNFNWRLVMAPLPVLDYVVVHELMHLVELNHSERFWRLVAQGCPEYQVHRDWLKQNGYRLTLACI